MGNGVRGVGVVPEVCLCIGICITVDLGPKWQLFIRGGIVLVTFNVVDMGRIPLEASQCIEDLGHAVPLRLDCSIRKDVWK